MVDSRTAPADPQASAQAISRAQALGPAPSTKRHLICAQVRHALAYAAARDGLWLRHELLAIPTRVAQGRRVGAIAPRVTDALTGSRQDRFHTRDCRQLQCACGTRGGKTGPNPTDRRKAGSKHHLLSDAQGVPLSIILTEANRHASTQLLPLVDAIPPIAGRRGRPLQRPHLVPGDRAYDSQSHRDALAARGIKSQLARRYSEHGSGLGKTRWVIERTIAWLHQCRRLRVRYERRSDIHEAFLKLGCSLICWRTLRAV